MRRLVPAVSVMLAGTALGTAVSGPIHGFGLDPGDLADALLLAPFEMTLGLGLFFRVAPEYSRLLVLLGLALSLGSAIRYVGRADRRALGGLFAGSALWSLGNVLTLHAPMSV
ncbi:MAG: hypothetical protein AAGN66_10895 [Acidobacteriota bacterium]